MKIGPGEILLIVAVLLLLFGAGRLPKLARSMREARHEFERGKDEDSVAKSATSGKAPTDSSSN